MNDGFCLGFFCWYLKNIEPRITNNRRPDVYWLVVRIFRNDLTRSFQDCGNGAIILFKLDMSVAIACVVASLVTLAIYVVTTRKTVQLNAGWNDEFE